MTILLIILIISIMFKSIHHLIFYKEISSLDRKKIVLEIVYTFIIVYCIFIIGFGLIYFLLSLSNEVLIDHEELNDSYISQLFTSLYFSGVTLLTIGYGDVSPVGIGRLLAILQSLLGYVIPSILVLRIVQLNQVLGRNQ